MSLRSRLLIASIMLLTTGGLISLSPSLLAQPPGFEKGKGFDKGKDFDKGGKGFDKDRGSQRQTEKADDPVKKLEDDLARLKALEADIQSQLKKLKEPPVAPAPRSSTGRGPDRGQGERGPGEAGRDRDQGGRGEPRRDRDQGARGPGDPGNRDQGGRGEPGRDRDQGGRGPGGPGGFGRGPGGPGGPGGFGRGPGGPGGGGPDGFRGRGSSGMARGIARALSYLSADQLKDIISELERVRAEKARAEAPPPRQIERRPGFEGRPGERGPGGRPGASQNDEILKRLDQISRELDDIRKSIKR